MTSFDFTPTGWEKAAWTLLKVPVWYFVTAVVLQASNTINFYSLQPQTQEKALIFLVANTLMAALWKWVNAHKPSEVVVPSVASPQVG